jgi:hypothetical protein
MSLEAMKQARDELEHIKAWCLRSLGIGLVDENKLASLRQAIAEAEKQEPVAKVVADGATVRLEWHSVDAAHNAKEGNLYADPQPKREPLIGQKIIDIADKFDWDKDCAVRFARAIEAAHGIKGKP